MTNSNGSVPGSLVVMDDVGFAYRNGTRAVDRVTLDVTRGRIISIVGPSGCGKSTLLSLLAGLVQPTEGSVTWSSNAAPPSLFTMMFQKDTLLPWLTVKGNVGFSFRYLSLGEEEIEARLAELLAMGHLTEYADAYPNQLSGGMRRRVAFLSSVAPYPDVLLLDEPFSALDEPTRVALHGDVLSIVRKLGMTVVLVTHDLGEAITLSDEVVILSQRPARVAEVHRIDLPRERDLLTLREHESYQETYAQLWAGLRRQIADGARESSRSGATWRGEA